MSCYEWERGEIRIPCRQWKDFFEKIQRAAGEKLMATDNGNRWEMEIDEGGALASFYPKLRVVRWSVEENNHACESARADPLARVLFRALGEVQWVRGSGGEIVGNDEYNRDSYRAGDGGNYVKSYYGPPRKNRTSKYLR